MADWIYNDFWNEALSQLEKELGSEEFNIWFSKLGYIRAGESELYVSVPNPFFMELFSPKYLARLTEKISQISEKDLEIKLEVRIKDEDNTNTDELSPASSPNSEQISPSQTQNKAQPANSGAADSSSTERKLNPQLQEEYTFDTYVVGEVNNYAFNAALAVSRNPGTSKIYNPLLIYGGTGLGKTHLMQAIGHSIYQNKDLKILYITGEGFMREFVEVVGMGQKNRDAFAKKYRNVDVLLIDDIHTIERGVGTQDELFYTFEALYNKRKQMVFTCDRPISELKGMAPRLQSRFHSGLSVELSLPRYEELIAILKKKIELKKAELNKDIGVSDEIIELIIKNISSNVRDMEGALNKLMGYADLVNRPVTLEIAQRELKDAFADPKQGNMSIDAIQKMVAETYNLTPNDLKGKKRTAGIVKARHIAIYLSRELTDNSLTEIGQCFGDRDHSTILHSHRLIEEETRSDTNLYMNLESLKRLIKEQNVR